MLFPRAVPLLALCSIAAFAQTPPTTSMREPFSAPRQPGAANLSCKLCAAPTEPGTLNGTNRNAVAKAIRSLGSLVLRPIRRSSRPAEEQVVSRNSPCSVPLVRVPIDPNVDPLMVLRLPAPTARMPQIRVPARPCDEPAAYGTRLVIPPRR